MYDLIRFMSEKEYADMFIQGKLYMNTIGYFWNNGFEEQRDYFEGTCMTKKALEIGFEDDLVPYIKDSVICRLEAMKYCNLLCMLRHGYDLNKKKVERIDPRMKEFGEYVVIVHNVDEFCNRVIDVMKQQCDSYGLMGPVEYHNRDELSNMLDCFDKFKQYEWQREWRIVYINNLGNLKQVANNNLEDKYEKAYTLEIGDISDIADIYKSEILFNNIQSIYKDCQEVTNISINIKEKKRIESLKVPLAYDAFCDEYIGWGTRGSFRSKINEISEGVKLMFSI